MFEKFFKALDEMIDDFRKMRLNRPNFISNDYVSKIEIYINDAKDQLINAVPEEKVRIISSLYDRFGEYLEFSRTEITKLKEQILKPEEKPVDKKIEVLTDEEIEKLFRNFGFDDEKIIKLRKNRHYTELKEKGVYENIENIFRLLHRYKFKASDFYELINQLLLVLIHSNDEIVQKEIDNVCDDLGIADISKENNSFLNFKNRFCKYLLFPQLFGIGISENDNVKKRNAQGTTGGQRGIIDYIGRHIQSEENRKFLKKNGIIFINTLNILDSNPSLIKHNLYILKKYGFSVKDINKAPSILGQYGLVEKIDLAIELGFFDKIIAYPSNLLISPLALHRIKYCQLNGISIDGRRANHSYELSSRISECSSGCFDDKKDPKGPEYIIKDGEELPLGKIEFNKSDYSITVRGYAKSMELVTQLSDQPIDYSDVLSDINEVLFKKEELLFEDNVLKLYIRELDKHFSYGALKYVFKFDGKYVVISRYKVLRYLAVTYKNGILSEKNINLRNIFIQALTYNSLLTKEEMDIIEKNIELIFNKNNEIINGSKISSEDSDLGYSGK